MRRMFDTAQCLYRQRTKLAMSRTEVKGSNFAGRRGIIQLATDERVTRWGQTMLRSRSVRTTGSALALMTAVALGDHAQAAGGLDASYTISFARIRVGDITASVVFGDSEYTISANGRAGGVMKALVDGAASFTARGMI